MKTGLVHFGNWRRTERDQKAWQGVAGRWIPLLALGLSFPAVADIPKDGLVGYWKGDHSAIDSSPGGHHGTFTGSYVDGGPLGYAAFNLATAKVVIPDPDYDFQHLPGWTVGFWFNYNGTPVDAGNGVFIAQDNGPGYQPKWFVDYNYSVYFEPKAFVLHFNDNNQERLFIVGPEIYPLPDPNGWHHLTVVVNNQTSEVSFYRDGTSLGTVNLPGYVLQTHAPLVFGYAEPGLGFAGLMNNVAIYNRALSDEEVENLVTGPWCTADFDRSGFVDIDDFIAFVAAFEAGSDDADTDHSGFVDLDDFVFFVHAFETGC